MADEYEKMSLFEQIKRGLEDSIAYSRGELSLVTTELPAPPPRLKPHAVARLRKRFGMSQAVFAATLNVSPKTVQSWEQGTREPSDAALRLLDVLAIQPQVVDRILRRGSSRTANAGAKRRRASVLARSCGKNGRRRSPVAKASS